jgi:hypothetical protein
LKIISLNLKGRVMKELIIHCSATPNGRYHNAEDIHRWHLENGWDGIGYHWVITTKGELQAGRPEYWKGSHAKGHNNAIGVCMIGADEFSDKQWEILTNLVLKKKIEYPLLKVIGHNEISNKSCPGFDVQWWLKNIK